MSGWTVRLYKGVRRGRIAIRSAVTKALLRCLGIGVGRGVVFAGPVTLDLDGDPRRIVIGDRVIFSGRLHLKNRENGAIVIGDGCAFDDALRLVAARESTIRIGAGTRTGKNLIINAGADVTIGADCLFSSHINIHSSQHRCLAGATVYEQGYVQEPVTLGRDVWLASNVNILFGTQVGDGAVAAPNTLLSGRYPAGAVIVGIPGVVVSERRNDLGPLHEMTDPVRHVEALNRMPRK